MPKLGCLLNWHLFPGGKWFMMHFSLATWSPTGVFFCPGAQDEQFVYSVLSVPSPWLLYSLQTLLWKQVLIFYSESFIWLYCWSSSAKQKMCRVPSISHLQMFDLTIAVMLPRGRRGGFTHTREWGGQTKGSCSKAHPTYQQIQSLLHRHSISIHNFLPWCKPPLPPPRIYPTYIL